MKLKRGHQQKKKINENQKLVLGKDNKISNQTFLTQWKKEKKYKLLSIRRAITIDAINIKKMIVFILRKLIKFKLLNLKMIIKDMNNSVLR